MKKALVIGGTSGLGLEIARRLSDHKVFVTGRKDPDEFEFIHLDLSEKELSSKIERLIEETGNIDILVFSAGFYQEGRLNELSEQDVSEMIRVGLEAPAIILRTVLQKQSLKSLIVVTSSSAWTPRLMEPVYTAVKGGLTMLSKSLSLDENIKKVLVVAPGGMATAFWSKTSKDLSGFLDPGFVADETMKHFLEEYSYREIEILRGASEAKIRDEM